MSTKAWGAIAIALIGGAVLASSGIVNIPGGDMLSFGDTEDPDDDTPTEVTGEQASVNEWELNSQIKFPQSPSSADVYLFKEEPENYGDYVDWDSSIATNGLSQGVDYYATTGASSDTVDLGHVPSGDYYMVVTDSNYHTAFKQVSVPETVGISFAENDKKITLANSADFDLTATYGSDNVVSYDSDGNVLTTGADLPDASNNASRTVEFVRNIEVDTGVSYLGDYEVTSFNDGDGIDEVTMTIEAGGHTCTVELKDGSSGELADGTSHGADLDTCIDAISDVQTDPVTENSEITMTFDVVYEADTAVNSAGDGAVGPGESILTFGLDDVQDSDVSTASYSLTG